MKKNVIFYFQFFIFSLGMMLLAPALVYAFDLTDRDDFFSPSITIVQEYNDNIYSNNTDPIEDMSTLLMPDFSFRLISEKNPLSISYIPIVQYFYKNDRWETNKQHVDLSFENKLSSKLLFKLTDALDHSDGLTVVESGLITQQDSKLTANDFNMGVFSQFSGLLNYAVTYNNYLTSAEDQLFEETIRRLSHTGGVGMEYRLTATMQCIWNYSLREAIFKDESRNSRQHALDIGIRKEFSDMASGEVRMGWQQKRFDGDYKKQSYPTIEAMLSSERALYTVALYYIYQLEDSSRAEFVGTRVHALTAKCTYKFTPSTWMVVSGTLKRYRFSDEQAVGIGLGDLKETFNILEVLFRQELTPYLILKGGWKQTDLNSDFNSLGFTQNKTFVSLNMKF